MAKYTLGALLAFVIIGSTAFYILARLNDGNAAILPAPPITLLITDPGPTQKDFDFEVNRPTEIRIDNRSAYQRILAWDGAEVEQLSNLKQQVPGAVVPRLYISAPPAGEASASVRFTKPGSYVMQLTVPGTKDGFEIRAHVE
jgi:hypothetical protein